MKIRNLFLCILLLLSVQHVHNVYAIDSATKIELRNSYNLFEKCMGEHKNDISNCLKEFAKAVEIHKKALKSNPNNEEIKSNLLKLVNALNDIAETFYTTAEIKRGVNPALSEKYYEKAAICYEELTKLYPSKPEFKDHLKNAKYFSSYERVIKYVFELKNRKRIDYALLSLDKIKAARDSFNSHHGQNKELNNSMFEVVNQLEKKVDVLFKKTKQNYKPDDMGSLIFLIEAQHDIIDFNNRQKHTDNLAQMEANVIQIIAVQVEDYQSHFENANALFIKKNYTVAGEKFEQLLIKIKSFPDYSEARQKHKLQINKAINNFDIVQFRTNTEAKEEEAKNTASFLVILDRGKKAFNQNDLLNAYKAFIEAKEFAKGKKIAVKDDLASKLLKKVQTKIEKLDEDEIVNIELATLHYKPIYYFEWRKMAKNGNFSKDYVVLKGSFQQKTGNIIILDNDLGLIAKKKRFFEEGDYISCIGKFDDIEEFETIFGTVVEVPIFKIVWIKG